MIENGKNNIKIATEIVGKQQESAEKYINFIVEKWSVFVSVMTTFLLIFIYIYQSAVFNYYTVSTEHLNDVNVFSIFPLLICLIGCSTIIYDYIGQFRIDNSLKLRRFNWNRVLYLGILIQLIIIGVLKNGSIVGIFLGYLFSFVIELILYLLKEFRKKTQASLMKKDFSLYEAVENKILFGNRVLLAGIAIITIISCAIPFIAELVLKSKVDYQTFHYKDRVYAVVIELDDFIICEEAEINNRKLTINTDSYILLDKVGIIYEFQRFKEVSLQSINSENE